MDREIEINVVSDLEYEKLVVEIHHLDKFVMLLSRESGTTMAEMPGLGLDESAIARVVPLCVLEQGIKLAKAKMREIRYD